MINTTKLSKKILPLLSIILFSIELLSSLSIIKFANLEILIICFIFIIVLHIIYCSKIIKNNYGYVLIIFYTSSVLSWLALAQIRNYILPSLIVLYILNIIFWLFYNKPYK